MLSISSTDTISITQIPNTQGYDGHSLRAFYYFPELLPDIEDTVESINTIAAKYPKVRQNSKPITFSLTYMGTYFTIMNDGGFEKEAAKRIEANYHKLYAVSTKWVEDKIAFAAKHGYTEVAFGFRMRTPTLKKCIYGSQSMPYEAKAEARTVGNAQGQSYGLLNNRSAIEVQREILDSPYAEDILPIAHIHDAQYFINKADTTILAWANQIITKSMQWQDLDAIRHDEVGLGGELDIFYPNWAYSVTLPLDVKPDQIEPLVEKHLDKVYTDA